MIFWLIVMLVFLFAGALGVWYLAEKLLRFGCFRFVSSKALRLFYAVLVVAAMVAVLCLIFDVTNAVVIVLHVAAFLLFGDAFRLLLRLCGVFLHYRGEGAMRTVSESTSFSGGFFSAAALTDVVILALCVVYLCFGWYFCHQQWQTNYLIGTKKEVGALRIWCCRDIRTAGSSSRWRRS